MSDKRQLTADAYTDVVAASFASLRTCFDAKRLAAAALGLGASLVLAAGLGFAASLFLISDALPGATLTAIGAAIIVYAGVLVTYAALAYMAISERGGSQVAPTAALAFALRRIHIAVGLPMFVMVVSIAVGSVSGWLALHVAAHETLGAALAPIVLIAAFILNLALACIVLLSHSLTGPCIACLDPSLAGASARLAQIAQQTFSSFIAAQVAVLAAGLPLLLATAGLVSVAFLPALRSVGMGRMNAATVQRAQDSPVPVPMDAPAAFGTAEPAPAGDGWASGLTDGVGVGFAPLVGVAAVVLLLVVAPLLVFASGAESAIYLALTGDEAVGVREVRAAPRAQVAPQKHPPIVHCWRCDAINHFAAERCSKCGTRLEVCPSCFTTHEVEREECANCGRRLVKGPILAEAEEEDLAS